MSVESILNDICIKNKNAIVKINPEDASNLPTISEDVVFPTDGRMGAFQGIKLITDDKVPKGTVIEIESEKNKNE